MGWNDGAPMKDEERGLVWQIDADFPRRRAYWMWRYAATVTAEVSRENSDRRWHAVTMLAETYVAEETWRDYVARDDAERLAEARRAR